MAEVQSINVVDLINWWRSNMAAGTVTRWRVALVLMQANILDATLRALRDKVPADVYVQRGLSQWRKDFDVAHNRLVNINATMEQLVGTAPAQPWNNAPVSAMWLGVAYPLLYNGAFGTGVLGELATLQNQILPLVPTTFWSTFYELMKTELGLSEGENLPPGYDWAASMISGAVAQMEEAAPGEDPTMRDRAKARAKEGFRAVAGVVEDWGWLAWVVGGVVLGSWLFG